MGCMVVLRLLGKGQDRGRARSSTAVLPASQRRTCDARLFARDLRSPRAGPCRRCDARAVPSTWTRLRASVTTLGSDLWGRRGWVLDRGPQIAVLLGLALVALGVAGFLGVLDAVAENDDL